MRRVFWIAFFLVCAGVDYAAGAVTSETRVESGYATEYSHFGSMVAIDGDRMAAATRNFQGNTNFVEVFGRTASGWGSEGVFGFAGTNVVESIDLSGDRLVVGIDVPGEVRVYRRGTTGWALEDTVEFTEGRGARVSLAGERIAVLMGSREQKGGGTFIYELQGGTWIERFATNIGGASIDTDGETVVVGSPTDPRLDAGNVKVYRRVLGEWRFEERIPAPAGMLIPFGRSVGVDGERLVVGSNIGRFNEGEAAVYRRTDNGYVEEQILGSGTVHDFYGQSVAMSGGTVAVGAPMGDNERGVVYVYRLKDGRWERTQLLASNAAGPVGDFGEAVSLRGNSLAVGAPDITVYPTHRDAGVVIIYELEAEKKAPIIKSVRWQHGEGGGFVMDWDVGEVNRLHRIEFKNTLADTEWKKLIEFVVTTQEVTSIDAAGTNTMTFYRVVSE